MSTSSLEVRAIRIAERASAEVRVLERRRIIATHGAGTRDLREEVETLASTVSELAGLVKDLATERGPRT